VFVRDAPSTEGRQIAAIKKGSVVCQGCINHPSVHAIDPDWICFTKLAILWASKDAELPRPLLSTYHGAPGYILREHSSYGVLLRKLPKTSGTCDTSNVSTFESAIAEYSAMDHWIVQSEQGAPIYSARDASSPVHISLRRGDVIVPQQVSPSIKLEKNMWWLPVDTGTKLYRQVQSNGQHVLQIDVLEAAGYIAIHKESQLQVQQVLASTCQNVRVQHVTGFGEPWRVMHDMVPVRDNPSKTAPLLGVMQRGAIIGVEKTSDDWVEMVSNSDLQLSRSSDDRRHYVAINNFRELQTNSLENITEQQGSVLFEPCLHQAWMLARHHHLGSLIEKCSSWDGHFTDECAVSWQRFKIYHEVLELCHKRVFRENLEDLWDGDQTKLPSLRSLEAKLFDGRTSVVHLSLKGTLAAGAILKVIPVRALVKEIPGMDLYKTGNSGRAGHMHICYIDCCAAVPGAGAGRMIWDIVSKIPVFLVACHSILRQKTVDFWLSRGMRQFDASRENDCSEFKEALLFHTANTIVCELPDVQDALPASKLPLLIWMRNSLGTSSVDVHFKYGFSPNDSDSTVVM